MSTFGQTKQYNVTPRVPSQQPTQVFGTSDPSYPDCGLDEFQAPSSPSPILGLRDWPPHSRDVDVFERGGHDANLTKNLLRDPLQVKGDGQDLADMGLQDDQSALRNATQRMPWGLTGDIPPAPGKPYVHANPGNATKDVELQMDGPPQAAPRRPWPGATAWPVGYPRWPQLASDSSMAPSSSAPEAVSSPDRAVASPDPRLAPRY
jgi:hypothetical protein